MSPILKTMLIFYSSVLLANGILSAVYWRKYKDAIVGWTSAIWLGVLLNFLVQGVFTEPGHALLTAFGTYILVTYALLKFSEKLLAFEFQKTPVFIASGLFFCLSHILWFSTQNFVVSAYAMSMAILIPMISCSFLLWKHNHYDHLETKILAGLILLNGVHFLDFPVLRFHPDGAIFGYSVALFLKILFSVTFPAVIIREASSRYQLKLKDEVAIRTKELEAVSAQNSTLLSLVCHDLATPLTVLKSSSEGIKRVIENQKWEDTAKYNQRIINAGNNIGDILSKVRNLQSVRIGKEKVQLERLSPVPLVHEAIEGCKTQAESKNLKIELINELDLDDQIMADPMMLKHQVITNLLTNAIKFSLSGTTIQVKLAKRNKKVSIEVVDQGIGIPANIIGHLFDFNTPTSRLGTSNEKGTGFGLPLVKTTLDFMGGEILVQSKVASPDNEFSGSTFTVLVDKAS